MPIGSTSAYSPARRVTALVRSLLNDANVNASLPIYLATIGRSGNVVTAVSVGPHGLIAGDQATIVGVVGGATSFNGTFYVTATPGPNSFQFAQTGPVENGTSSTGTVANVGQGAIWTDGTVLPYVNAGYRKVQRALRNIGQPSPIVDNYLLVVAAIPATPGPDPSLQVSITDETPAPNQLPSDLLVPLRISERPNGTTQDFMRMADMTDEGGLPSWPQDQSLHMWEWRSDGIYFLGATQDTQIRIRYQSMYADLTDGSSPILIRDSVDAIGFSAAGFAAQSRGAPTAQAWDLLFQDAMEDLIAGATRQLQRKARRRRSFSSRGGVTSF